jgi:hypothetical protein
LANIEFSDVGRIKMSKKLLGNKKKRKAESVRRSSEAL